MTEQTIKTIKNVLIIVVSVITFLALMMQTFYMYDSLVTFSMKTVVNLLAVVGIVSIGGLSAYVIKNF